MQNKFEKTSLELRLMKKKQDALIGKTAIQLISDLKPYMDKRSDELESFFSGKMGKPGLGLLETKKKEDAILKEAADWLVSELEAEIGKSFGEPERPVVVRVIAGLLEIYAEARVTSERKIERLVQLVHEQQKVMNKVVCAQEESIEAIAGVASKMAVTRRLGFKKRIEKRADQVDRRAYKKAVQAKLPQYATIEDAVRDQQKKSRFKKRTRSTLLRWAKEIWPHTPKAGRPPTVKLM